MQRETKTIQTPSGHKVELYTYITGREKRAIVGSYLNSGIDFDSSNEKIKGINAKMIDEAQNVTINSIIVSVNGHRNGDDINGKAFSVVDAVLDMHATDYEFVINELNEITKDKNFEQKKTI